MRHSRSELFTLVAAVALAAAVPRPAGAQRRPPPPRPVPQMMRFDTTALVATMVLAEPSPTPGREGESGVARTLAWAGFQRDSLGNFVARRGSGSPRRVVACGFDRTGYVVSEITDDGYLRLHGSGNGPRHPLWDQFHEGQRVVVAGARGEVPGVVAVRSTHLWRRRGTEEPPVTIENLWVDVGARSRSEAERAGVALLAPVRRAPAAGAFGRDTLLAGADMGSRAGCAAVSAAARSTPARGETIYVLSAQSSFGWTGLSAVLARVGPVDSLFVVDPGLARPDSAPPGGAVTTRVVVPTFDLPGRPARSPITALAVRSRFPGTLVESVAAADVAALGAAVRSAAGVANPPGSPRALFTDVVNAVYDAPASDSVAAVAELLGGLTEVYAVSEHEGRMRDAVLAALPAWARTRTRTDSAGNLVLALGPDRDTVVFVAHLDEIGFEITRITGDGTVSLRTRGGFYNSLWEGQVALLHYESDADGRRLRGAASCPLRAAPGTDGWVAGVFVPRESATTKQPAEMRAWFGTDSAGLVACGVRPGMALTGFKSATRLLGTRFTARSIDDRAGCTALILALRDLDPAKLTHKVIFTWSVREETALGGAAAMAATFGPTVKRVYAVDTFVSSDSPLESQRFAFAPIGAGAVVRALDNSSATPPGETARVMRIARDAGIPLQVGTTNGGNDGSELARYGAVDVPVAWPLRYSHSPAEVIDLVDVRSLARLVGALARR